MCGFLDTPFKNRKMEGRFSDISYIMYNIADFQNQQIIQYFDSNFEWIEERIAEGRNILVHCAAGVSRSASFVIAYLIKKYNLSF